MRGLLLVNIGSPASPHRKDVRVFVEAMLSDPLVMTVSDWFRPILVKGIIGPFRQFSSAKKYRQIWSKEHNGFPLMHSACQLAGLIEERIKIPVEVGMAYLEPSISGAMARLIDRGSNISEIIVLPLFPHYAESSYLTSVRKVQKAYNEGGYSSGLRIVEPYFNHPGYISALAKSIEPYIREDYERFIFNFHSLPLSHVEKGFEQGKEFDYVFQVKETVRLVEHKLGLEPKQTRVVFSSAFGKRWLEPSLNRQVEEMGRSGIKKVIAVSPGFAADNLETLYDIDIVAKNIFLQHGGEKFTYIPCLNYEQYWVDAIQQII